MTGPDARALGWAAETTGVGDLVVLRGLRDGGSPWLLRAGDREVVLRTGQPDDLASFATEAAALRLAARAGVPAPRLLGYDEGDEDDQGPRPGGPVLLMERLPGSSGIPPEPDPAHLRALGAAAARLHALPVEPSAGRAADDLPYGTPSPLWPLPPDMGWFPDAIAGQGRPDLDRTTLLQRRDAFLRQALDLIRG